MSSNQGNNNSNGNDNGWQPPDVCQRRRLWEDDSARLDRALGWEDWPKVELVGNPDIELSKEKEYWERQYKMLAQDWNKVCTILQLAGVQVWSEEIGSGSKHKRQQPSSYPDRKVVWSWRYGETLGTGYSNMIAALNDAVRWLISAKRAR